MGHNQGDREQTSAEQAAEVPEVPDFNPSRQIGWIFRDGDCVAVERQSEEALRHVLVD